MVLKNTGWLERKKKRSLVLAAEVLHFHLVAERLEQLLDAVLSEVGDLDVPGRAPRRVPELDLVVAEAELGLA